MDKAPKLRNDRTWCFWTSTPTDFDEIIAHRWKRLAFLSEDAERRENLRAYEYQLLRGIDFYRHTQAAFDRMPHLDIRYGTVQQVGEDEQGPFVVLDGAVIRANWVFNSCYTPPETVERRQVRPALLQHFLGWTIRTEHDRFDPTTPILMDFREAQGSFTHFYYLLPFSEREALVELTYFSPSVHPKESYRKKLAGYLSRYWSAESFETVDEEFGVIPMQGGLLPSSPQSKVIRLGTLGGAVKPTTGYAFLRIQEQTQMLVRQLEAGQAPRLPEWKHDRFAFYDDLLLYILHEQGRLGKAIFSRLFRHNPMDRILTFLNEDSHLIQEGLLFSTLPKWPFFRAIWGLYGTTGMKTWTQPLPG